MTINSFGGFTVRNFHLNFDLPFEKGNCESQPQTTYTLECLRFYNRNYLWVFELLHRWKRCLAMCGDEHFTKFKRAFVCKGLSEETFFSYLSRTCPNICLNNVLLRDELLITWCTWTSDGFFNFNFKFYDVNILLRLLIDLNP